MHISAQNSARFALAGLALGAVVAMAACSKSPTAGAVSADEMTKGSPNAKVTLIEYASVACPHCAEFNESTMKQLDEKYIKPGKIKYVYRPMLTGVPTIAASGQLLAQCAGKDKYFTVIDAVMRGQQEFYAQGEADTLARPVLLRIAQSVGMDENAFNKCVTNETALKALDANNNKALEAGIDSTPTFFVNGKKVEYKGSIAEFDAAIAEAQASAK